MKTREYQKKMKKDLYVKYKSGQKRVLLVAPTGAGKTVISADIINDAVSRGRRILFLIHRNVLAKQTAKTLEKWGIYSGFIISDMPESPMAPVQIASVQTLDSRGLECVEGFDLIVYDEAHIVAWSSVGKKLLERDCWHCGLTATPWRRSKKQHMDQLFPSTIYAPMPGELIKMGFLVQPRYFSLDCPDLSGVEIQDGDYKINQLDHACNTPETISHAVESYLQLARGLKTIVFTVTVKHAENVAAALSAAGVKCAVVTGSTSQKKREIIYQQLANGEIDVISSCDALSEGFDYPGVQCIMLLRPTKSQAKYYQQLGRGLRIAEGKIEVIILDQSGNVRAFGRAENLKVDDCPGYMGDGEWLPCPDKKQVIYNNDLYWNDDNEFQLVKDKLRMRQCPSCGTRPKGDGFVGRCKGHLTIDKQQIDCEWEGEIYGGRCIDCMRRNYCAHSVDLCTCHDTNKGICCDRIQCTTKSPIGDLCQFHVQLSRPSLTKTIETTKPLIQIGKNAMTPEEMYKRWLIMAFNNGYAPEWASVQYNQRFGSWPKNTLKKNAVFENPTTNDKQKYLEYLEFVANKKAKDEKWVASQYKAQFGEVLPREYQLNRF